MKVDNCSIPRNESVNLRGGESEEAPKLEHCICSEPQWSTAVESEGFSFDVPMYCKRCGKKM